MRAPDYARDGWCLEDGKDYHRAAPTTFHIPDLELRRLLQPGDLAKLIFKIAIEGDERGAVERIWVIVRERTPTGYIGMLDNEPDSIAKNDQFWLGTEFPFEYRHIIAVAPDDETSIALAKAPVRPGTAQARMHAAACRLSEAATPWQHVPGLVQLRNMHGHPATQLRDGSQAKMPGHR